MQKQSDKYIFATSAEIQSLGINTDLRKLSETTADHSTKIIEENEGALIKIPEHGKIYRVSIRYH